MSLSKIREFLKGKKAYIAATVGLLGAVAAWADAQITNVEMLTAVWVAAQVIFIRAGITTEAQKAQ